MPGTSSSTTKFWLKRKRKLKERKDNLTSIGRMDLQESQRNGDPISLQEYIFQVTQGRAEGHRTGLLVA